MTRQVVSTDVSATLFLSEPMRLAFSKIDSNFTELYASGGASGANPTGTIGLTAVNGVATTFLRSDGAPALSQAISPTWSGTHTFSITPVVPNDSFTYAKLQNVSATSRILGRVTAGAGDIEELTGTQATTLLDAFTSGLKGLAPASGGGTTNFLRADGTWAVPPGGGGGTSFGNNWDWTTTATRITFQFPTIAANYLEVDDDGVDGSLFVGGCEVIEIVANDTLDLVSAGVLTASADAGGLLGEASLVLDPTDILGAKASLNGKLVELASTNTVTLSASTNTIILDGTTASFNGDINFNNGGNTTVGAPGAASVLPIAPTGYVFIRVGMGLFQIPYYARA